jgi:hypothetical protein
MAKTSVLSWTSGDDATRHDVYFGTNHDTVEQADSRDVRGVYRGRQTATTYDVSDELALGEEYYWRIDELDKFNQIHKGTVWSFTVAEYLVVDDFESYDDACQQIFYTWLDGVGYTASAACGKTPYAGNGTGSMVQKATEPDAKRTKVYSGEQSMQLTYDNRTTPYYSQTERTFSPVQDWTRFDVNMVTVYLRGDPTNSSDPLYLEVADSAQHVKRISHPDPEAVSRGYWKRWDILLSEFAAGNVNLKSIKKMRIEIGDRTAGGGQGQVYIDDIRLSKGGSTPGLVAHWEFEEGSGDITSDSAGSDDGTVMGALWVPGKIGTALWFDGLNDYVDCGSSASLSPAEMTTALWVFCEGSASSQYILGKAVCAPGSAKLSFSRDYALLTGTNGSLEFSFGESESSQVAVRSNGSFPVGQWVHVAATRDGSTASLYMNGQLEGSVPYTFAVTNKGQGLRIGSAGSKDGWPEFFQGMIDDACIYEEALTSEQIQELAADQR